MAASSEQAPPRVKVVRQGCRVAQADADAALLACDAVSPDARPDAVLVSTCAVTADAESAALQAVRRAAREHPGVPVVVCGCLAKLRTAELQELPGVAAVLGPGEVSETARALLAAATGRAELEPRALRLGARARPVLKIQDGCDQRCAYCVVPLARGRSRSAPWDDVLRRVAELGQVSDEIVLAGVHLGAYGRDLERSHVDLAALIDEIGGRRLVHRLRLSSIDPLEFPVAALRGAAADLLCPSFHLPVQSGSDRVLRSMGRPYRAAEVARVVESIVAAVPGAWIGADVITGFPGETDADHRDTVALLGALPLASLHVFCFSPRPGTPAVTLPDPVPAHVARERAAELRSLSDGAWRAAVDSLAGSEVEAVVERTDATEARGTTREGVLARWRGAGLRRGGAVRLRAMSREDDALRCEPA